MPVRVSAGGVRASPTTPGLPHNVFSGKNLDIFTASLTTTPRPALSAWSPTDHAAMREARSLARLGSGRTWTNPMVGAVVVVNGDVVGSGYHHRAGEAPRFQRAAFAHVAPHAIHAHLHVAVQFTVAFQ